MDLVEEFTMRLDAAVPTPIGDGPFGRRVVHAIGGGEVSGERIRGRVRGVSDSSLVGPDGFLRIDARGQIETHDGAFLYVQYRGLLELSETLQHALVNGGDTGFEDQYCRVHLWIETGDERYAWVNTALFIAKGRALAGGKVEYCVCCAV